ncbi:MAG: PRC-barrel domain containing protein [Nitrospirota bacterium]
MSTSKAATEQKRGTLRSVKRLSGFTIFAKDGDIGIAHELLFDDDTWAIKYLVVHTGPIIAGRKVLIAPEAFSYLVPKAEQFHLKLTREQVSNSPTIEADKPVSLQHQREVHHYFGWPWIFMGSRSAIPAPLPETEEREKQLTEQTEERDPHLRSSKGIINSYDIEAADGKLGHVEDFLVDDASWIIRYMVVDTRDWLPGKKALVATQWIAHIDFERARVHVDLLKEKIKNSPEYDPLKTVDRDYEELIHNHYGRRGYWW